MCDLSVCEQNSSLLEALYLLSIHRLFQYTQPKQMDLNRPFVKSLYVDSKTESRKPEKMAKPVQKPISNTNNPPLKRTVQLAKHQFL